MTKHSLVCAVIAAAFVGLSPAAADPPPWSKGKGHGKGHGKGRAHDAQPAQVHPQEHHFTDDQRVFIRDYYDNQFRRGHCPPGLAKKNNGCMPPGQAKKWQLGRPLPTDVVYYNVPQTIVARIGAPPPGHQYVRVASDILMITVGTRIVAAAIENLGRS